MTHTQDIVLYTAITLIAVFALWQFIAAGLDLAESYMVEKRIRNSRSKRD